MRLGYFTMPLHPMERSPTDTLHEDREAIILADRLGFYDAFVGEHLTEKTENITSSMLFLATLISDTKTIKLATGTSNLSQMHPVLIASHAAMFDHLAQGPLHFRHQRRRARVRRGSARQPGRGPQQDVRRGDRRHPRDLGARHAVRHRFPGQPLQGVGGEDAAISSTDAATSTSRSRSRGPEIVGTVVAPFSKGVIAMGERDFHPLSANFLLAKWLPSHWANYSEGKRKAGQTPDPADWRIARTIFVADDDKVARRYGRDDPQSPYRYYWRMLLHKMMRGEAAGRVQVRSLAARFRS